MRLTTGTEHLALKESASPTWTVLIAGMLLIVFLIDRATGTASFQHLYYLPIIVAGTRFTMRGGLGAGLAAVLLYHAANPQLLARHYEESDAVQVALFLAVGVVTAKLTSDKRTLHELASTDDLTGLRNLRSFEACLAGLVRASSPLNSALALLVVDVDNLKSVNDRYGHLAGAEGVRMVGHIIGRHLPPNAVACRYGGDEFAIVVPDCDIIRSRRIAADLCQAVRFSGPALVSAADKITLTISVGATSMARRELPANDTDAGECLFKRADRALYQAKASGRDRAFVV